jgi:hypothetical protein
VCALLFASIASMPIDARAQGSTEPSLPPPSGPLVLRLSPTPRTTALGGAWVAGRDQDVLFFNPAQLIGARAGLDVAITRHGPSSTMATLGSSYAAGPMSLTLGWGVQMLSFSAAADAPYPYAPDVVLATTPANASSAQLSVGGAVVYKGFRIGGAGKYVVDRAPASVLGAGDPNRHALAVDVGVARNLFSGVAAASVQNLGAIDEETSELVLPRQALFGWSLSRAAGPVDLMIVSQLTVRSEWTSPAAGLEVGYSWIEGYTVAGRIGVRRPETTAEQPIALGGAFTADRLTVEYAVQFFDAGRRSHGVTIRWR